MKCAPSRANLKVRAVREQCATYERLLRVRVQLQRCCACLARWPHPWLLRELGELEFEDEEAPDSGLDSLRKDAGRVLLRLVASQRPLSGLKLDDDNPFQALDSLPSRRGDILGQLDHWNQRTCVKVDKSFEVLGRSISSQLHYFLDNIDGFLKKARPTSAPENVVGLDLLKERLGPQQGRAAVIGELYNDQLFYVQLLRFLVSAGADADADVREEERQLRNDQSDKPRMSVAKTSKSRRLRYTVIDKLQNFVERTRKKTAASPELVDLIIRSLFKA